MAQRESNKGGNSNAFVKQHSTSSVLMPLPLPFLHLDPRKRKSPEEEEEFGHRQPEPVGVAAVSCHAAGCAGEARRRRPLRLHVPPRRRQRSGGGRGGQLPPVRGR